MRAFGYLSEINANWGLSEIVGETQPDGDSTSHYIRIIGNTNTDSSCRL